MTYKDDYMSWAGGFSACLFLENEIVPNSYSKNAKTYDDIVDLHDSTIWFFLCCVFLVDYTLAYHLLFHI